jgi:hypothetical protein
MTEWEKFERMVSLKSESIELGSIDDFANALSNMVLEPSGNIGNKINEMRSELNKHISDLETILGRINTVAKIGVDVERQVKELGLELPGKYKSAKERLMSEETRIKKSINVWKSAAQNLINP